VAVFDRPLTAALTTGSLALLHQVKIDIFKYLAYLLVGQKVLVHLFLFF